MSTDQPTAHRIDPVDAADKKTPPRERKRPLRTYSRRSIQTKAQEQEEELSQGDGCVSASTPDMGRTDTPVQLPALPTHRHTEQDGPAQQSSRGSILAYFKPLPPSSDAPFGVASSDPAEPQSTPPTSPSSSRARKRRRLTTRPQFGEFEQHVGSDAGDTADSADGDGDGDGKGDGQPPGKAAVDKQPRCSLSESTIIVGGAKYDTLRPALSEVAGNSLCHQDEPPSYVADGGSKIKKRLDKRPAKDMTQTTLSLSVHKEPGFTMCSVCDILYNPLNEKDRKEHNQLLGFQQLSHIESALSLLSKMVHQHGDHAEIPDKDRVNRPGAWLPADNRVHREWLGRTIDHIDEHGEKELIPVLREFKQLIEENPRIYMYFTEMWDEIPNKAPYQNDPTGESQIRDYDHMLQVLNHVFGRAPEWTDAAASVGMVGVPMAAIFDYAMGTPSGHAAFLDPDVNRMLKKILNEWGKYLKSPESAEVLRDHQTGWFGAVGYKDLMQVANGPNGTCHPYGALLTRCRVADRETPDFFTRKVQESARPVAAPDNDDIIANPCESKVFNVTRNAKLRDKFWVKGQPYSVIDMLGNDPLAEQFAGATVYQAFLSALSYHRWHAPVSGTVKRCFVRDGTYFSEPLFESSAEGGDIDRGGITVAQGYLSSLATRAVIFFEADKPALGLVAFIGVGMDEVSTCEITVREGQHVKKGDETGMFHFGGSSFCLLFREGVPLGGFPETGRKENVPVRGPLAVVGSA
ncbi:Phophatidylserine decarboxylase-domain-containing protein [Chaetomium tenue]|uniref:Phophatidylserine decarboxylase-domain-containing protein n=1 Tax=Chaetomium tenue TaxID=1854479 RepID=A0ACB7NZ75_9PEZI|nr:Phophatidylserine decarboxylase-domain-containing protein [Chaetomium globosum]